MPPITPDEVIKKKKEMIPDEVLEVFDEVIAENFSNGSSMFRYSDVDKRIADRLGISVYDVYKNKYLDIEEIYIEAGWDVDCDNPGFNETYEGNWTFKCSK